jgi:KaiC/GvpD/RAD55 family RecA-like ATPase
MSEKLNYLKTIAESIEDVRKEGPIPFIWGGIKEGSFGYVFGPSKSGKTTFCENLAMSLVSRKEMFLGNAILERDHRILFVSLEEYERPRSERNDKQIKFLDAPLAFIENYLVIRDEFPKFLRDDKELEILSDTIAESKAGVVFIDSLTRMSSGDIEKSDTARIISLKLKEIAAIRGITMVVIHHTPKLNGRMLTIDSLAGSHVFAQEADFIIGINKIVSLTKFNGTRYIKEVACRYKKEDDEKVMLFEINEHMWLDPKGYIPEIKLFDSQDGRIDDTSLKSVRSIIKKASMNNPDKSFNSQDILKEAVVSMDRSTFFEKLRTLSETGEISKTGKGLYIFNSPPSVT